MVFAEVDCSPARANASSISSSVRFFDLRKALRCSSGEAATDGALRTDHQKFQNNTLSLT